MPHSVNWHGKPYYSLDAYCKNTYGEKLWKVSLNAGLSCPNRDGSLGSRGCIFCSGGGSGDFAVPFYAPPSSGPFGNGNAFELACQESLAMISRKNTGQKYIPSFQAFTNTYGPVPYLERIYRLALSHPLTAGISIATRPDCLPGPVMALLSKLKAEYAPKFIWVELGLQTIHAPSAAFIRRGYPLSCFDEGLSKLCHAGIPAVAHVILGLPGETREDMLSTIRYLNSKGPWGIKLQLLHILKDTDLGRLWETDPASCGSFPTAGEYLEALIGCLEQLRPDMVVHRVTGDAPKNLLLAPKWSGSKRYVLNLLHKCMKERGSFQGKYYRQGQNASLPLPVPGNL